MRKLTEKEIYYVYQSSEPNRLKHFISRVCDWGKVVFCENDGIIYCWSDEEYALMYNRDCEYTATKVYDFYRHLKDKQKTDAVAYLAIFPNDKGYARVTIEDLFILTKDDLIYRNGRTWARSLKVDESKYYEICVKYSLINSKSDKRIK
jgi:hypothetical protein